MMTIEDYALDVGKTIDEIKALCDKIGINYEDEKTPLDETDIILLDNELQDAEDYVTGDVEDLEEKTIPVGGFSFLEGNLANLFRRFSISSSSESSSIFWSTYSGLQIIQINFLK